jgi:hypothetical protein
MFAFVLRMMPLVDAQYYSQYYFSSTNYLDGVFERGVFSTNALFLK